MLKKCYYIYYYYLILYSYVVRGRYSRVHHNIMFIEKIQIHAYCDMLAILRAYCLSTILAEPCLCPERNLDKAHTF